MRTILLLFLLCGMAEARLGETIDQCATRYGEPLLKDPGGYAYKKNGFIVVCVFSNGQVSWESFQKEDKTDLSTDDIQTLLTADSDGKTWNAIPDPKGQEAIWKRDDGAQANYNPVGKCLLILSKSHVDEEEAEQRKKLQGF